MHVRATFLHGLRESAATDVVREAGERLNDDEAVDAVLGVVYFGGKNFHFIVGFTALNAVNAPTASGEMAAGLNVDLGRHWGIDALAFAPVGASDTGPSVLLDIRYAF